MATQYYATPDLVEPVVARRYWGGDEAGVRVEIFDGVRRLGSLVQWIYGDDGSHTNLLTLSAEAGYGGLLWRLRNGLDDTR